MTDSPLHNEPSPRAESHRGFVREIDQAFASTYALGGGIALALAAAALLGLGLTGLVSWIAAACLALTAGLAGLFVARALVARSRARLRDRVGTYASANGLLVDELREYFRRDNTYTYFDALFEPTARERHSRAEPPP